MGEYDVIPPRILAGLARYVEAGIKPGDFLTAVLENRFVQAVCRADDDCYPMLRQIAHFVYNEIPAACWGSHENVVAWMAKKRLEAWFVDVQRGASGLTDAGDPDPQPVPLPDGDRNGQEITSERQVAGPQARTQARAA